MRYIVWWSCFLFLGLTCAAMPSEWWRIPHPGELQLGELIFRVVHYGPGACRTPALPLIEKQWLTVETKKIDMNTYGYRAVFNALEKQKTLGLCLELTIPVQSLQAEFDGQKIVFPGEYIPEQWIIFGKRRGKAFSIVMPGAPRLTISGDLEIRIQDNRRFASDTFTIRFYFTPGEGQIDRAVLPLTFQIIPREVYPIALTAAVTAGYIDDIPGDGQGGWTDQGPQNDLRQFSAGRVAFGGIYFDAIKPDKPQYKAVIALGVPGPNQPKLPSSSPEGFCICYTPAPGNAPGILGHIVVTYKNGEKQLIPVKNGIDVGNWWQPENLPNAVMAWSAENPSSNIGLYFSQFELKRGDATTLEFRIVNTSSNWLIVAADCAPEQLPVAGMNTTTYIVAGKEWSQLASPGGIEPGSVLDFSFMLDAPAGKHGVTRVAPNGHFTFADTPATRIKFVGTNLCFSANYLSHEEADRLAEQLAQMGYNAVRIHHHDILLVKKGAGPELDPQKLDQLEYLFAALKKRGIYIVTDVYVSRTITAADNIPEADLRYKELSFQMKQLLPISPAARENWKTFARNWLGHRNPYTGMTWVEDPALVSLSLANENNLDSSWESTPKIRTLYVAEFARWMARNYPREKLGDTTLTNRRFTQFLYEIQHKSILELADFLKKELKFQGLYCDLNMHNNVPLALSRNDMDLVDDHKYHDHPSFPVNPWQLPYQHRQRSAIANFGTEVPEKLLAPRLFGKPFCITEYKYCAPNRFRAEEGPLIGGYAALQDWDGLYKFAWSHSRRSLVENAPIGAFDTVSDPLSQLTDRLTMFLFRRGDVSPAKNAFAYSVPANFWNTDEALDYPLAFSRLGLISQVGTLVGAKNISDVTTLNVQQSSGQVPLPNPAVEALRQKMLATGVAESDNGQIVLDANAGTLKIVTPKTESLTITKPGNLAGKILAITGAKIPQTICISSLDNQAISESRKLLLFHLTDVANTQMKFWGTGFRRLESWGTLPLLVRVIRPPSS